MHYLVYSVISILLWACLATLVAHLTHVPPLFLLAVTLLAGGSLSIFRYRRWSFDWRLLVFGVSGIFGYHFLLIMAFRLADPVAANLLNYLWPLLIVVLTPLLLSGFQLTARHLLGALLGFAGAYVLIGFSPSITDESSIVGYLMALAAAFVWAGYSLLSKRFVTMSTASVGLFCLISGALAILLHLLTEPVFSLNLGDGWRLLLLGLGPMGLAFYTWDAGLKRGDPRVIGTLSYMTPLLSTLLLAWCTGRALSREVLLAMLLIVGGAVIGGFSWKRREPAAIAGGQ